MGLTILKATLDTMVTSTLSLVINRCEPIGKIFIFRSTSRTSSEQGFIKLNPGKSNRLNLPNYSTSPTAIFVLHTLWCFQFINTGSFYPHASTRIAQTYTNITTADVAILNERRWLPFCLILGQILSWIVHGINHKSIAVNQHIGISRLRMASMRRRKRLNWHLFFSIWYDLYDAGFRSLQHMKIFINHMAKKFIVLDVDETSKKVW